MNIYSRDQNLDEFNKLRKKKWNGWEFLVRGEWSQSLYHQGNVVFEYSLDKSEKYCGLMFNSFPSRIVCITKLAEHTNLTTAISQMLFHLYANNAEYIDYVKEGCNDEIKFTDIWSEYRELVKEYRESKRK